MADAADDKPESWWQRNGDYVWEVIGYIAALLVIVAFFTSYGVVFGIFKSVGDGRKVDVFRNVIDNSTVAQPLLNITCTLSVTDSKYGVDVSLDLNCTTGLPDAIVLNTLFLATPFNVIFNRQLSTFSEGDVPGIVSQTIPWASGSVQDYPFDSYYADLSLFIFLGHVPITNRSQLVDLTVEAEETVISSIRYSWDLNTYNVGPGESGFMALRVSAKRTQIGLVYPVWLIVAFWLLTLALGSLGIWVVVLQRRMAEPSLLSLTMSSIFSLPSLRNTAPQSPAFGCQLDYCAFFWAELTAVLVLCGIMARYIIQTAPKQRRRRTRKDAELKKL